MKILITGAGGFLGKHIIGQMTRTGKNIIFATSLSFDGLEAYEGKICFIPNADIMSFDFSQIDLVINCAFPRAADGAGYARGIHFLSELLKRIQPFDRCGMMDISSQSLYPSSRRFPADEDTPLALETEYDVGKYCVELLMDAVLCGHKRVHLRLASLIGPDFDQRIVNRFARAVAQGGDLVVNGGKQLFGFLDVRDCADAICSVAAQWDKVDDRGQVFNVGAEKSKSLLEIAQTVVSIGREFGFDQARIVIGAPDVWKNTGLNAAKFCDRFSWKPRYGLEDTVREIYKRLV
ncbi:MAG: NAD(P)-dependent oxidoreductase [Clostridia bacterium]|nr:NAD(P)-dependent oxidoreductase [Clostridia bacterium]